MLSLIPHKHTHKYLKTFINLDFTFVYFFGEGRYDFCKRLCFKNVSELSICYIRGYKTPTPQQTPNKHPTNLVRCRWGFLNIFMFKNISKGCILFRLYLRHFSTTQIKKLVEISLVKNLQLLLG